MSSLVRNSWYDCAAYAQVVCHHEATIELRCEDGTHIHLKHRTEEAFAPPAIGASILLCDWSNDYDADCMDCLGGTMHCNFERHGIEPTRFLVFDVEWIERLFDWDAADRMIGFATTFHVLDTNDIVLAIVGRDDRRDNKSNLMSNLAKLAGRYVDQSNPVNLFFNSPLISTRTKMEAMLNVGTTLGTKRMMADADEALREVLRDQAA